MAPEKQQALMAVLVMVRSGLIPSSMMRPITVNASRWRPASAHASIADVRTTCKGWGRDRIRGRIRGRIRKKGE